MRERGQEPFIAFKLNELMEQVNINFIRSDQRDTYLSKYGFLFFFVLFGGRGVFFCYTCFSTPILLRHHHIYN